MAHCRILQKNQDIEGNVCGLNRKKGIFSVESRRTILFLIGLCVALVGGIFVWQMTALPSLKIQIQTGLNAALERIAIEAAEDLDEVFSVNATEGARRLKRRIPASGFRPDRLRDLNSDFMLAATAQPLANAWLAVFPRQDNRGFNAFEFRLPNKFRKSGGYTGDWRSRSDLTEFVEKSLQGIMAPYATVDSFAKSYWVSALDSNISFNYNPEFENSLLIGMPFFNRQSQKLIGFVFNQTNTEYFEKVYVPDFFRNRFWQENKPREGIEKKHVQFSVMSGKGNKVIFSNVAFGHTDYNTLVDLAAMSTLLSGYKIGIAFRDSDLERVTDAIYSRNIFLAVTLYILLMVVLLLLYRAAARLLRLSRMKTEFVANVSHEIKTPLASIRLAADTLKLGRVKSMDQLQPIVKILDREAERLQYLIHTLLDFSQLEAGRKKYKKEPVEVGGWAEDLGQYFLEKTGDLGSIDKKDLPHGMIRIDRKAVEQMLDIFIDNARKYSDPGSKVVLHLYGDSKSVSFAVQDFGIGIKKEDQGLVFEKFVRIGNLDVHNVKGHGIGLSIAKAITQDHGGKIGVKSKLGEGSTFFITFPLLVKKNHERPEKETTDR